MPPGAGPELYAIPGNHDWYDGLSSFTRIFCQQKWIGGWKTRQRRSYFALKLPHNWWLWGIDIQLEGYIDEPQLRYFYEVGRDHVKDGDRVILCTAEPSWVYGVTKGPDAYRSLRYFEDRYVSHPKTHPARLAVTLTGDLHHYVRYESADGLQRVTAGGGGAYLFATHSMPKDFDLEEGFKETTRTVHYERKGCFPDTGTSKALTFGILRLPIQSWRFGLFLACVYAFFGWILQSASKSRPDLVGRSLMDYLHGKDLGSWGEALRTVGSLLGNTPMSVFLCLLIVGGFTAFCSAKNGLVRFLVGFGHGTAHVLLNLGLIWLFARLGVGTLGFLIGMLLLGGLLGSILMALYLLLFSFVGGFHLGEAYSGQRIADYKNFLRIHLDKAGNLTIYPIGVRKIGRWKPRQNPAEGEPWFEPDGPAPQPELIEGPIEVPPGLGNRLEIPE